MTFNSQVATKNDDMHVLCIAKIRLSYIYKWISLSCAKKTALSHKANTKFNFQMVLELRSYAQI